MKLYPPRHPAVKNPLARFLDSIRPRIFENNHVFIRFYEGLIVVDGDPAYDLAGQSEEVCALFHEKKLEGFQAHPGLSRGHLGIGVRPTAVHPHDGSSR